MKSYEQAIERYAQHGLDREMGGSMSPWEGTDIRMVAFIFDVDVLEVSRAIDTKKVELEKIMRASWD